MAKKSVDQDAVEKIRLVDPLLTKDAALASEKKTGYQNKKSPKKKAGG